MFVVGSFYSDIEVDAMTNSSLYRKSEEWPGLLYKYLRTLYLSSFSLNKSIREKTDIKQQQKDKSTKGRKKNGKEEDIQTDT